MPVVEEGLFAEADAVAGLSDIPHISSGFTAASAHCRLQFAASTIIKKKKKNKKNRSIPLKMSCPAGVIDGA